jgi:hypothetical protein
MDLGQALSGLAKPAPGVKPVSGMKPVKKVVDLNQRGRAPIARKIAKKPLITPGGKY